MTDRPTSRARALEQYRAGRLTQPELRRLLGFETRAELDGFLKEHGVFEPYTVADLERERQTLDRLGLFRADDEAPAPLTPEDQAAIATSKSAAARGEFATDDQVRAVWAKHGLGRSSQPDNEPAA